MSSLRSRGRSIIFRMELVEADYLSPASKLAQVIVCWQIATVPDQSLLTVNRLPWTVGRKAATVA